MGVRAMVMMAAGVVMGAGAMSLAQATVEPETRAALLRPPVGFVGLIGSATKRARFLSRLEKDGVGAAARARLTSPIGVAGVTGKEPDVIAIATLAQLLQLRCAA